MTRLPFSLLNENHRFILLLDFPPYSFYRVLALIDWHVWARVSLRICGIINAPSRSPYPFYTQAHPTNAIAIRLTG
ncbi:MAG: hypothetical protein AAGH67_10250 [Cyanobacteria bacterium P01_H01_bin.162]